MRLDDKLEIDIADIVRKRDRSIPMPWQIPDQREIRRREAPRVRIPAPGQGNAYQPETPAGGPQEVYIDFNI